jgi:O-antigen/teichoic acid export membrane protein
VLNRVSAAWGLLRRGGIGRREKLIAYGTTRTAAEGLLALRQLALAGILGPEMFGAWALFRILMSYFPLAGLGTVRALEVEVARAGVGRPEVERAEQQALWGQTMVGLVLVVFVPVSAAAALVALWLPESPLRMALGGVAATLLLDRLWTYAYTYLRAVGHLKRFAMIETLQALLQAVLTTVMALAWGLQGAVLGMLVASLAGVCLLARSVPVRPALLPERLRGLIRLGLPICLTGVLTTALMTADRIVVGSLAGIDDLGRYAFAVSLAGLGMVSAYVVRAVIFPEVYSGSAVSGVAENTRLHVERTLRPFAVLLSPIAGLAALALAPLITWMMPTYADTVLVAQLFVFVGLAQGLTTLTTLGIIAADQQRILPLLSLAALVLTVAISVAALEAGFGLLGVAAGALIARTAGAAGLIHRLLRIAGFSFPLKTAVSVILPFVWSSAAVVVVGYAVPVTGPLALALAFVLYTALVTPLAVVTRSMWARPVTRWMRSATK